ncbi:putative monovalent cation/H+ antiporter subunit B [Salinisphaera dokdonensis CL-ES53]|uniref:Monovalent cation/H+ antiporter subunit B n=1 Tax=Salinisphaera dokdonensis CL-ES53 TaxID=1304272 RepID=A0ABV2B5C4_9GAMM
MTTDIVLNIVLLSFMAITGLAIARLRNLFPVAMLTGLYSLLSASLFTLLDAVDVALTEAAVGAGVTTVLFLATFGLTRAREKPVQRSRTIIGLVVTVLTGAALFYATLDMPHFGERHTPVHDHPLRERYLQTVSEEIDVPNTVTAVLGSYRGYDTLGEVTVILTAGIGVLMLLGVAWRRRPEDDEEQEPPR